MSDNVTPARGIRALALPVAVAVALWVAALIGAGILFVVATEAARAATEDAVFPQTLLGMPVLESFHRHGRIGMRLEWGLLVLLLAPLAVGAALSILGLRRLGRDRS